MIKKRNLDPSLVQWIMTTTGIGPGIGAIKYLVPAQSSTSQYREWLNGMGVLESDMFTDMPTAYAALEAYRNDVLLVFPGTYTQTAKITWAKDSTHLVGVGSPNQRIPATAGTSGNVYFPCATAMTELFLITGHHCVLANFSTYLSTATGVADIRVQGRVNTLKNIFMKSGQDATQIASAVLGYGLYCDGSSGNYCNALTVEGCHIGDPRNTTRTAGGMILMAGDGTNSGGHCIEFKDCVIAGWTETAGVSAVYQSGAKPIDRYTLWQDCTFYNFYTNLGGILTAGVFNDTVGGTHMNLLTGRTCQYGWNVWGNNDNYMFGQMPIPAVNGGKMLTMTG